NNNNNNNITTTSSNAPTKSGSGANGLMGEILRTSPECKDFIRKCLIRDVNSRYHIGDCLHHPFLTRWNDINTAHSIAVEIEMSSPDKQASSGAALSSSIRGDMQEQLMFADQVIALPTATTSVSPLPPRYCCTNYTSTNTNTNTNTNANVNTDINTNASTNTNNPNDTNDTNDTNSNSNSNSNSNNSGNNTCYYKFKIVEWNERGDHNHNHKEQKQRKKKKKTATNTTPHRRDIDIPTEKKEEVLREDKEDDDDDDGDDDNDNDNDNDNDDDNDDNESFEHLRESLKRKHFHGRNDESIKAARKAAFATPINQLLRAKSMHNILTKSLPPLSLDMPSRTMSSVY
ncbi:PHD zinc finger-containing protein, partial [Reticulomyxa filosa]